MYKVYTIHDITKHPKQTLELHNTTVDKIRLVNGKCFNISKKKKKGQCLSTRMALFYITLHNDFVKCLTQNCLMWHVRGLWLLPKIEFNPRVKRLFVHPFQNFKIPHQQVSFYWKYTQKQGASFLFSTLILINLNMDVNHAMPK